MVKKMNTTLKFLYNLCVIDVNNFYNYELNWGVYLFIFAILFLENGLLPAAFLPGDSLLILLGVLISKEKLDFFFILILLTVSASLGSWLSYLQGKWLKKSKFIRNWLIHIPEHYHHKAQKMFCRYGFSALLIGRFIVFMRTLLPIIIGISGLTHPSFHIFNWISSFLWVFILTMTGFIFGKTKIFQYYEHKLMLFLVFLPLVLLFIGLLSFLIFFYRKKVLLNSKKITNNKKNFN